MAASYPSSIKTYTTLVDAVDYPQAVHINSPQDEISAIETELGINPRSIDDTVAPGATPASVAAYLDMIANQVKAITGKANWYTAPVASLETGFLRLTGGTLTGALNFAVGAVARLGTTDAFDLIFKRNAVDKLTLGSALATFVDPVVLPADPTTALQAATKQYVDARFITTLKTGSGAGNYTNATAGYADVDGTNLAYTVTVPTGRKLIIRATGTVGRNGAASGTSTSVQLAIADGTTALIESGSIAVDESNGTQYANSPTMFVLQWVFAGDGASHTFKLRWNPVNTVGVFMANSTSTIKPVMIFEEVNG